MSDRPNNYRLGIGLDNHHEYPRAHHFNYSRSTSNEGKAFYDREQAKWPHKSTDHSIHHPLYLDTAVCGFWWYGSRHTLARGVSRSDEQLKPLREGLVQGRSSIIYGATKGTTLADMEPFHGTASRFLQDVCVGVRRCSFPAEKGK